VKSRATTFWFISEKSEVTRREGIAYQTKKIGAVSGSGGERRLSEKRGRAGKNHLFLTLNFHVEKGKRRGTGGHPGGGGRSRKVEERFTGLLLG